MLNGWCRCVERFDLRAAILLQHIDQMTAGCRNVGAIAVTIFLRAVRLRPDLLLASSFDVGTSLRAQMILAKRPRDRE